MAGPLHINNAMVLRQMALDGIGLVLLSAWLVGGDIETGRLRPVLTGWQATPSGPDSGIYAVYLPSRRASNKVRAFIDFFAAHIGSPPYWDSAG